jgi:hypothetical protein
MDWLLHHTKGRLLPYARGCCVGWVEVEGGRYKIMRGVKIEGGGEIYVCGGVGGLICAYVLCMWICSVCVCVCVCVND